MVLFVFSLFFSFFIPGSLFISALRLPEKINKYETFLYSWLSGIAIFLLVSYGFAYLNSPKLTLIFLATCLVIWIILLAKLFFQKKIKAFNTRSVDFFSLLIILVGSFLFASLLFFSGLQTHNGLQFFGVNGDDGIRHIGFITDQVTHFPPQQPSVSGEPLLGFHYFYDFLLSRFSLFYSFSALDLYFRFFPLFISLLYGMSFLALGRKITESKTTHRLILFFAYFARSSSVFILLLNQPDTLTQPLGLILNPFIVLSIALLVGGIVLLPDIKKSWKYSIVVGMVFGVLSQIKVYAGLIAIACIIAYAIYLVIRYKTKYILSLSIVLFLTGLLTALTFFPNNLGQGGLIFAPLLFYEHYMQTPLFNVLQWGNRYAAYTQEHNYFYVSILFIIGILIFFLLNLGLRLVTLYKIKSLFTKAFWIQDMNFLLFISMIFPVLIASFFIQSISVFDTIQFFWIFLSLLSIPTGIIIGEILQKTKPWVVCAVLFFIALVSIPGVISIEYQYVFSNQKVTISLPNEYVLSKVADIVPPNSFVTLLPRSPQVISSNVILPEGTPYISALSQRQVYFERGWVPTIDQTKYLVRQKTIVELKTALIQCLPGRISSILEHIGSPYVLSIGTYPCLAPTLPVIKKITANGAIITLYEFKFQ